MNNPSSLSSRWRPGGAEEESFLTVRDWISFQPFKSKLLVIYPLIIFWRHFCLTSFVIVRIIIWRLLCQRTSLAKLLANIKGAVWFMWQQQQSTSFFFQNRFCKTTNLWLFQLWKCWCNILEVHKSLFERHQKIGLKFASQQQSAKLLHHLFNFLHKVLWGKLRSFWLSNKAATKGFLSDQLLLALGADWGNKCYVLGRLVISIFGPPNHFLSSKVSGKKSSGEEGAPLPPQRMSNFISGQGGYPPNCCFWDLIEMTLAVEDANSQTCFYCGWCWCYFLNTWILGNMVKLRVWQQLRVIAKV